MGDEEVTEVVSAEGTDDTAAETEDDGAAVDAE